MDRQPEQIPKVHDHCKFLPSERLQYLQYFLETKKKLCCQWQTQIDRAIRIIQKAFKDLRKRITLHQVAIKRTKMAKVVSVDSLRKFHEAAKAKIPELLGESLSRSGFLPRRINFFLPLSINSCACVCVFSDALEENNMLANCYCFYCYFSAFVVSLYEHRPGLVTNTLLEQVEAEKKSGSGEMGYILNVRGPSLSV